MVVPHLSFVLKRAVVVRQDIWHEGEGEGTRGVFGCIAVRKGTFHRHGCCLLLRCGLTLTECLLRFSFNLSGDVLAHLV